MKFCYKITIALMGRNVGNLNEGQAMSHNNNNNIRIFIQDKTLQRIIVVINVCPVKNDREKHSN